MTFVIFHGSFGSPEGNWFPQLKENLEALDQKVIVPRFPVEDWQEISEKGPDVPNKIQNLDSWLEKFENEVIPLAKHDKLVFVGHSLGPLFILHAVAKYKIQVECAVFVSPFLTELKRKDLWQFDLVNSTFYKNDFDFKKLKKNIFRSYVLYGDNDPYVPKIQTLEFGQKVGGSLIEIKGGGDLNSEFGYNSFPLVLELCKTRLLLKQNKSKT